VNVPFVVRCAQCRQEVLDADLLGDEEECALRDHLLAVHPNTVQPETLSVLLRHFVVTKPTPPAEASIDTSMPTAFGLHPWTIRGTSAAGMDTIVPVHGVTLHGRAAQGSSCSCRQSPAPQKAASRLARRA